MPADALRTLSPGDDSLSSATWNAMVAATRIVQGTAGGGGQFGNPLQAAVIRVRNDSGADRDRFDILGLQGPVIRPDDNLLSFLSQVCLSAVTPVAALHAGRFVILQEPIPAGMIGRAALAGASYARVRGDAGYGCADVIDGDPTALGFADGGSVQVLVVTDLVTDTLSGSGSGSGSGDYAGDYWAVVRFGNACVLPAGAEHGSGSGSGSGEGGPGAACALCDANTPLTWAVPLSGFTGDLAVFNGAWTLAQLADACSWRYADATRTVWLDKLASGFRQRLYTQDGDFEVEYLGGNDDCCADQVLGTYSVLTGSPSGSAPSSATASPQCGSVPCPDPCDHCEAGVAPAAWGWTAGASDWADNGGCTWAQLNSQALSLGVRGGACQWHATNTHGHDLTLEFLANVGPVLTVHNRAGACDAVYRRPTSVAWNAPWDCCAPLPLVPFGTPVAGTPASIVLTPSGGCCPAGGGGGGGVAGTSCCPSDTVPSLLYAHVTGGGACDGSYPITWGAAAGTWNTQAAFGTCPPATGFNTNVAMNCSGGLWNLTAGSSAAGASSATCPTPGPFQVVFTGIDLTHCGGSASATVTVLTT